MKESQPNHITPDHLTHVLPNADRSTLESVADRLNTTVASPEDLALAADDEAAHQHPAVDQAEAILDDPDDTALPGTPED